MIGDTIITSIS